MDWMSSFDDAPGINDDPAAAARLEYLDKLDAEDIDWKLTALELENHIRELTTQNANQAKYIQELQLTIARLRQKIK